MRKQAAETLGKMKSARAVFALIAAAVKDRNEEVRDKAEEALKNIGGVAAPSLIAALKYRNWRMRVLAAEPLGKIEDSRAVPRLIAALRDGKKQVRRAAAEALKNFSDPRAKKALWLAGYNDD